MEYYESILNYFVDDEKILRLGVIRIYRRDLSWLIENFKDLSTGIAGNFANVSQTK